MQRLGPRVLRSRPRLQTKSAVTKAKGCTSRVQRLGHWYNDQGEGYTTRVQRPWARVHTTRVQRPEPRCNDQDKGCTALQGFSDQCQRWGRTTKKHTIMVSPILKFNGSLSRRHINPLHTYAISGHAQGIPRLWLVNRNSLSNRMADIRRHVQYYGQNLWRHFWLVTKYTEMKIRLSPGPDKIRMWHGAIFGNFKETHFREITLSCKFRDVCIWTCWRH